MSEELEEMFVCESAGKLKLAESLEVLPTDRLIEMLSNQFVKIFGLFFGIINEINPIEQRVAGEKMIAEAIISDRVSINLNELEYCFKYANDIVIVLNNRKSRGSSADLSEVQHLLNDIYHRLEPLNGFIDRLRKQGSTWFDTPQIKPGDPRLASNSLSNKQKFQKCYFNLMLVISNLKKVVGEFDGLRNLEIPQYENKLSGDVADALKTALRGKTPSLP
jgi:hypothetical protein